MEAKLRMRHDLDEDWNRVVKVWRKWRASQWNPSLAVFAEITELRELDRGIDYPLRRLLDSEKYGWYVRGYGAPTSTYSKMNPFRHNNGRLYVLIRVKVEEFYEKEAKA